jgi:uncharacterized protein
MRVLIAVLLLVSGISAHAGSAAIPAFTPNVVDPGHVLDASATERVNAEIQRVREASHIWGAVYIVETLGDESIEELAVRAFEQWKLGQAGVDNGLLLVLAMTERQSRLEVGYGLEGTITDLAAKHALDDYLRPKMREGDVAGAIVDAFGYVSRLVEQDPAAIAELAAVPADGGGQVDEENWSRGVQAWAVFLLPVWLGVPFYKWWIAMRRRRLLAEHPVLALKGDENVANADKAADAKPGSSWKQTLGISLFLTVNPGVFVFFLAAIEKAVYYGALIVPGLLVLLVAWLNGRKYGSPERYEAFLRNVAQERVDLLSKGHLVQDAGGRYSYTPAYHASRRSSSSSSGSSRSSSSGGGRSGGGGASSSW